MTIATPESGMKITRDMTIDSILTTHTEKAPMLIEVMSAAGLHCVGCGAAVYETLEQGIVGHGYSSEYLETLLQDLNEVLDDSPKEDLAPVAAENFTLTMTARAVAQVRHMKALEEKPDSSLRIAVITGGCSGYSYDMHFVEKPFEGDVHTIHDGMDVYIAQSSLEVLDGIEVDYVMTLNESGFKYNNPNADSSCGCGLSFKSALPFMKSEK